MNELTVQEKLYNFLGDELYKEFILEHDDYKYKNSLERFWKNKNRIDELILHAFSWKSSRRGAEFWAEKYAEAEELENGTRSL